MRIGALALLLLAFAACTHAPREPSEADDARRRYFVETRAFPFGEIPAGARREALEAWHRTRRVASESTGSWKPVGGGSLGVAYPFRNANGRVTAVAVSPADPRVILIGASGGGILRSGDGGLTFVPVADDQYDLSVGDIAFASADVVYAGMGDSGLQTTLGTGVLRSDDGGRSWRHVSADPLLDRGAIRQVVINPDDPENVWIVQEASLAMSGAGREVGGIFESQDGGRNWTRRMFGRAFGLMRINATTLVAGQTQRIIRTVDGGVHWTSALRVTSAGDIYLAASPSDSSLINGMAIENKGMPNERTTVFVSHDAGATWQSSTASGIDADDFPYGYLTFSPADSRTLFRGLRDLWRSTDGGAHWTNLTKNYDGNNFDASDATMHADQHALAFASDGAVWLANDGGLYVSRDGAQHFTFAGPATTSLVELYGLAAHPLDPARLYGPTQDNGLLIYPTGGRWSEARSGDYGSVLFDLPHSHILTNFVYANLRRCDLDGLHCDEVANNAEFGEPKDGPRIEFIAPLVMNTTTRAVYFATFKLWVSTDFGSNWHTTAATDLTRGEHDFVAAIGITEANANAIYTGSWQGRVMRSADGGTTWSDVTANLPLRSIASIVTSGDGATAWVAFSGYHSGHIYRTTDGGASWSRIDAGLPDLPVDTLFLDGATLWAGTDAGAFRLGSDGMWELIGSGMPAVIVTAFTRTVDGRLLAATHGRGVYEFVPPAEAPPRRRATR